MDGVYWALLLKPFAALLFLAALYAIGLYVVPLLERVWPKWLFKDRLFRPMGQPPR